MSADVGLDQERSVDDNKKLLRDEASPMIHYLENSRNPEAWWRLFWLGVI